MLDRCTECWQAKESIKNCTVITKKRDNDGTDGTDVLCGEKFDKVRIFPLRPLFSYIRSVCMCVCVLV